MIHKNLIKTGIVLAGLTVFSIVGFGIAFGYGGGGMTVTTGGGGGPAYVPPVTPTVTTPATGGGQVLGAAAFNFTMTLSLGSRNGDVTALQTLLTEQGFYTGPITGYFGPLTQAAVKAFQQKYGMSATGLVGSLTRAQLNGLNGGRVLGASTTGAAALQAQIAALQAQLVILLQQLAAMLQGR
ncbi:MAG: peptidoglycan-binding domain-containing protein [Minisyncoccia bacterium]|jgi:peptidoglycan hydrolase-like protein with peptidoglycan-binding domain